VERALITRVAALDALDALDELDRETRPITVIAAGKAAPSMAAAATRILGQRIRRGLVVSPQVVTISAASAPFESIAGGHPTPTAESEHAGREALAVARTVAADGMLLVLLSGGASAMMAVPADGVSLDDKRETTARLLRAGADIRALNTVRKHISAIKGGRLAAATPGESRTLAISDVVDDDLSVIASGPTVADASTFEEALAVLGRFGGAGEYPSSVVTRLTAGTRGEVFETPKPGDRRLSRAGASVIGGRRHAMEGAAAAAHRRGYTILRIDDAVVGEARTAAVRHLGDVRAGAAGIARPACIVSSGETTVRVTGHGKGGRNQEFALAAADALAAMAAPAALGSAGTDGVDGPTDAAGAIADTTTLDRARAAGLREPAHYLQENNAYAFFAALGDLVLTGPTGTNVGDLQVILLA
jgi:glycerate 2-kinase